MIRISEVFRNRKSFAFFSFVIGFGLTVLLLSKPIISTPELALSAKDIEGKVVKVDGKCYSYRVEDATCENLGS